MFLFPKKIKYTRSFTGIKIFKKNTNKSYNTSNHYGNLSLIAVEHGKISNFQQEAIRRFLRRSLKKKAQVFFRTFPSMSITKKPMDTRQGRGKGNVKYWFCAIKRGNTLLEVCDFDHTTTKKILESTRCKFTIKTAVNNRLLWWIF